MTAQSVSWLRRGRDSAVFHHHSDAYAAKNAAVRPLAADACTSPAHRPVLILMPPSMRRCAQVRKAASSCRGYADGFANLRAPAVSNQ